MHYLRHEIFIEAVPVSAVHFFSINLRLIFWNNFGLTYSSLHCPAFVSQGNPGLPGLDGIMVSFHILISQCLLNSHWCCFLFFTMVFKALKGKLELRWNRWSIYIFQKTRYWEDNVWTSSCLKSFQTFGQGPAWSRTLHDS